LSKRACRELLFADRSKRQAGGLRLLLRIRAGR
jgi:hypothetical protein